MENSNHIKLSTDRLDLVAATLEHACVELESLERFESLLGATIEPGWPPGEYDRAAQEFFRDRLQEGGEEAVGWYNWYVIRRAQPDQPAVVIGTAGYIGPPDANGEVEIGCSVMPAWERQGYATEMIRALVVRAFADSRVHKVVARTTLQNQPSRRVLEKSGFQSVSVDEETGNCRYEIVRNSPAEQTR